MNCQVRIYHFQRTMILDKIKEMGDNLKLLEGHDRLHYLIDKAREIEPLPEAAKTEENRIHGCASKLWLIGGVREEHMENFKSTDRSPPNADANLNAAANWPNLSTTLHN